MLVFKGVNYVTLLLEKYKHGVVYLIQTGMAHFTIMWQGSLDIAHSQLKGIQNNNEIKSSKIFLVYFFSL